MSDPQNPGDDNRHPMFYFLDGSAVFQAHRPGLLYKLHSSVLRFRPAFFKTLFSLPRGPNVDPDVRTEGASDMNPIQLPPSLNRDDFDHLLCHIYMGPTMHPKTEDFLVSILKLSTFFEITDGIDHAIREFTKKGDDFHPALQFELARLYRVDDWIEPAFRRLMKMPITCLNMFCAEQIGPPGYFCLVQTKAHIEHLRKQFAFDTPKIIHDPNCASVVTCRYAWIREWMTNVRKLIHHPDASMSLIELLNALCDTEIDDLCDGCRKLTVS
ncbi:hypothetical protein B0H19DRAFT_952714 [Mycena capillaripes]|nr:hypothetical protein B0H19DRAFT_952714 [Mycena capillaripes]